MNTDINTTVKLINSSKYHLGLLQFNEARQCAEKAYFEKGPVKHSYEEDIENG